MGLTGDQGVRGPTGATGNKGAKGSAGSAGERGFRGTMGAKGNPGYPFQFDGKWFGQRIVTIKVEEYDVSIVARDQDWSISFVFYISSEK